MSSGKRISPKYKICVFGEILLKMGGFCAKIKRGDSMQTVNEALEKLKKSAFRSKFHLSEKDREYIRRQGLSKIRLHCRDFIKTRLAPAYIKNDGKQTPMRGHPCFVAQHACACCCRGCLEKWYRVKRGTELTETQQEKIVNLLMAWIEMDLASGSEN